MVQETMLWVLILAATIAIIGVVLAASRIVEWRSQRASDNTPWDAEADQAQGNPLQAAKVLEDAELLLKIARKVSLARSAEASRDAASRPTDAWVDEKLWHTLDKL
jgi:hypothetical protein